MLVRRGGRRGSYKNDLRPLGDRSRPLHVQRVLDQIAGSAKSAGAGADGEWLAVAGDGLGLIGRRVRRQAEGAPEGGDVRQRDVAGAGDGDGLARPVDRRACRPQRQQVVDGGEIIGRHIFNAIGAIAAAGRHADAELGPDARRGRRYCGSTHLSRPLSRGFISGNCAPHAMLRPGKEVVQRFNADYHRRQRSRNRRIRHVADMLLALHIQVVNLRMESALHLPRSAVEADRHAVLADVGD
jgi:hypothetical protein